MTGPVAKAEAWVRVVPSSAVATGKQADALVAGTRKFYVLIERKNLEPRKPRTYYLFSISGSHGTLQQRQGLGYWREELCHRN